MYGGIVADGGRDISTNSIYLFQLSHNTIVSYTNNKAIDNKNNACTFNFISRTGSVLNKDQYLMMDCGLKEDTVMPVLLSMVSLPHLH